MSQTSGNSNDSARIVLINPAMDIKAGFGEFAKMMEPMPCIGIAYLASALKRAGHQVLCIDNFALNLPVKTLLQKIDNFDAEYVGQSCLTPTAKVAFDFNDLLKKTRPHLGRILGNVHASVFAKDILQKKQADFILEGECETSLPLFLRRHKQSGDLSEIPGLHFLDGDGCYQVTGPPEPVSDLDELPEPDWSGLPWEKYTFLPFVTVARPVAAIMGSRGCPYRCTFCALGYQGRYRLRSPESIVGEMDRLVKEMGARHIGFVDPIFPIKKDHLFRMCELIRQGGLQKKMSWTAETRVDCVDKEMMQQMKSAGMRRILFGIESGSDRLLKNVNKNFTVEQARRAVAWTKEVGLETSCFFILGLPGETVEESKKTVRFPVELDVDFAKFAILVPLPGSKLYEDLVEQGKLGTGDWEKFTTFNPSAEDLPFVPEGMTGKELIAMQKYANLRFYFRPKIILRHLFKIRTISLTQLFAGFSVWLRWKIFG